MKRPASNAALGLITVAFLGAGCSSGSAGGSTASSGPGTSPTSRVTGPTAPSTITGPTAATGPTLPGLNTGPAPWPPESRHLAERLEAIGLPPLGAEVTDVHFHVNLVVSVNGRPVPVPVGIGFLGNRLAEIHTHAGRGTIHIEGAKARNYTLGMVFDVWGVRFTPDCIGGYCAHGTNRVRVFVDGRPFEGDPRNLSLSNEQVIVVTYGTEDQIPNPMPARFVYEGRPKPA